MARKKRKQGKQAPSAIERFIRPTDERENHNPTESAGAARRVTPPIVMLHRQGKIDDKQLEALAYYRDQAGLAHKSPTRDSCDFSVRGEGSGPGAAITSASIETSRLERELGALAPMARFVVRDDNTLTRWCIEQHGGRERYDKNGRFIAMVPRCEQRVMRDAVQDIRAIARTLADKI